MGTLRIAELSSDLSIDRCAASSDLAEDRELFEHLSPRLETAQAQSKPRDPKSSDLGTAGNHCKSYLVCDRRAVSVASVRKSIGEKLEFQAAYDQKRYLPYT